jgi:hypothetical protein
MLPSLRATSAALQFIRVGAFTERDDYADFHLQAEFKTDSNGDSGIFFRCRLPGTMSYQADISFYTDKMKKLASRTGMVYKDLNVIAQVRESLIRPDKWSSIEVIAEGRRIRVLGERQNDR